MQAEYEIWTKPHNRYKAGSPIPSHHQRPHNAVIFHTPIPATGLVGLRATTYSGSGQMGPRRNINHVRRHLGVHAIGRTSRLRRVYGSSTVCWWFTGSGDVSVGLILGDTEVATLTHGWGGVRGMEYHSISSPIDIECEVGGIGSRYRENGFQSKRRDYSTSLQKLARNFYSCLTSGLPSPSAIADAP